MRLGEALQINQRPVSAQGQLRKIHLVCGFTPLHFETLLKAHARLRFSGDAVEILTGLFGDFEGNLQRASAEPADGAVVGLEWSDLDGRLSLRASAGWSEQVLTDILQHVPEKLGRVGAGIAELAKQMRVALIPPTLPLPPLTHFPVAQASAFELQLRCALASFLNSAGSLRRVAVVNESELSIRSPHAARHDVKLDLHAGFPYTIPHTAAMAELGLECLFPAPAKKGLVTDLDETLWKGVLGDVGVEGVSWDLDNRSQDHALYQQMLGSLAEAGVLIGIASKNDPAIVQKAFARPDILLKAQQVFPFEVSWGAKSKAFERILEAWNISPDSVVFVDDSPMELAEVAEKFPDVECLRFPADDPAGIPSLLSELRRRFGKTEVREEDRLRLESLRSAGEAGVTGLAEASGDFVARLNATITLQSSTVADLGRPLELVNKTNQFNLNGRRYTEQEWQSYFRQPGAFSVCAGYQDRFGPLGNIAVLAGRVLPGKINVDVWVMSCRAFSRHIEFHMLQHLFSKHNVAQIDFSFEPTPRNGPTVEFFRRFYTDDMPPTNVTLSAEVFQQKCPQLFHRIVEHTDG